MNFPIIGMVKMPLICMEWFQGKDRSLCHLNLPHLALRTTSSLPEMNRENGYTI